LQRDSAGLLGPPSHGLTIIRIVLFLQKEYL